MATAAIKAVRTRYRNILEREEEKLKVIISSFNENVDDVEECIKKVNKCIHVITSDCSKLSEHMDKILKAVGENDDSSVQAKVESDCELILKCEQDILRLQPVLIR
ncbi:hypothetical protein DPMN_049711 [Dreissena polymorpha]|uniref:Uncharacterized protein n=1 Tax=Dreissena polymorpha TaxID=45954 RepID=A0A9D4HNK1_DREPO|nr:hypothetical protein DPMN_049711 [Dreissena polymorpha]